MPLTSKNAALKRESGASINRKQLAISRQLAFYGLT